MGNFGDWPITSHAMNSSQADRTSCYSNGMSPNANVLTRKSYKGPSTAWISAEITCWLLVCAMVSFKSMTLTHLNY